MKRLLTLLFLAIAAGTVLAQPANDAERCRTADDNPDLAIKHCSAAIAAGKTSGDALAVLYASRGAAWANKGEADRAIADFDAALKLRPSYPYALHARGVESTVRGDYTRALADLDSAVKLDPQSHGARFARGRLLFYQGESARAVADMEAAFKADANTYVAIWLYLARKRAGVANAETLLANETRGKAIGMAHAIIAFLTGRTDTEGLMMATQDSDAARQRESRCEAHFYTAQWYLIRDDRAAALDQLRAAEKLCPRNILEYEGLLAELRRLK